LTIWSVDEQSAIRRAFGKRGPRKGVDRLAAVCDTDGLPRWHHLQVRFSAAVNRLLAGGDA
jgi:hypothetical protein